MVAKTFNSSATLIFSVYKMGRLVLPISGEWPSHYLHLQMKKGPNPGPLTFLTLFFIERILHFHGNQEKPVCKNPWGPQKGK